MTKRLLHPDNPHVWTYDGAYDDQILELYDAGWSIRYIGRELGVSRSHIQTRLIHHGIAIRGRNAYPPSRISHKDVNKTVFLYRDCGWNLREVANYLGVNPSSVQYRLKRAGVPTRSRGKRPPPRLTHLLAA